MSGAEWIQDGVVSVDGYSCQGHYADHHDHALDIIDQLADDLAAPPFVLQVEHQLERHVQTSDQQITDGQRSQEHVRNGSQFLVGGDYEENDGVTGQRHDDDCDVGDEEGRTVFGGDVFR